MKNCIIMSEMLIEARLTNDAKWQGVKAEAGKSASD